MNEKISVEKPEQSQDVIHLHSSTYNLFILVMTIFSWIVAAGLIIQGLTLTASGVLWRVDFYICVVFLVDFCLNLWRAPNKANYFFAKGGWLDLLGSIPSVPGLLWVSVFRLARLNQFLRIIKHLQGKDRDEVINEARQSPAKTALLTITIAAFVLVTITSLLILTIERRAPGANIRTGSDAFWWALVTITTIGYGDYVPVTFLGRMLAAVLMTFGIGIFAVLTSFVAARVVRLQDDQKDIRAIIKEENDAIRAELAEIKELLKQRGLVDDDENRAE